MRTVFPRPGGQVLAPGFQGRAPRGAGRFAVAGIAVILAAPLAVIVWHLVTPAPRPAARYGSLPAWLPTPTVPVGRVATASAAHPWLAIEGDTVSVQLARAHVLATAVGPAVPEEGHFPVPQTTRCTFTFTLAWASGTVLLSAAAFTIVDEFGHLHHPRVMAQGGRPLPSRVTPGQTVTITIRDRLPTGSGQLRWTPDGGKPIVSWDFDVEID